MTQLKKVCMSGPADLPVPLDLPLDFGGLASAHWQEGSWHIVYTTRRVGWLARLRRWFVTRWSWQL